MQLFSLCIGTGSARASVAALCLLLGTGLTGCGKGGGLGGMVEDVQVSTIERDGQLYGQLTATLNTGAMMIAGLDVPIVNPKQPGKILGHVSINSNFCGQSFCGGSVLKVDMNISAISNGGPLDHTLPNGAPVPIGNIEQGAVVALPIGHTGARLYVGMGKNVALVGFALPFKQFDSIGQYVPGVNLWQPFDLGEKGRGIVGIFTGMQPGQSGLGLFVDLSGVLKKSSLQMVRGEFGAASNVKQQLVPMAGVESQPSKRDMKKLIRKINELNSRGELLVVQ